MVARGGLVALLLAVVGGYTLASGGQKDAGGRAREAAGAGGRGPGRRAPAPGRGGSGRAGAASCAMLQQSLGARLGNEVACAGADVCTCTVPVVPGQSRSRGKYATTAGTLSITPMGGAVETYSYCVSGATFKYSFPWTDSQ